jgi:hypothetical protein
MTTYQTIAAFIFRLLGTIWTLYLVLAWSCYALERATGIEVVSIPAHTVIGNMGYIVLGLFAIFMSKPIGRFVGHGLGT